MLPPILPQLTLKDLYFTEITIIPLVLCTTHIYHSKHTYFTLKPSVYISKYLNVTTIRITDGFMYDFMT
jgi:hypothetical protein